MFAAKDQKAMFRVGAKVTVDWAIGHTFKVTAKSWGINGAVSYTVTNVDDADEIFSGVRQKDLNKVVA